MLSRTAIFGRKVSIVSSWKLEISRTFQPSARDCSVNATTGTPMLPPTKVGTPEARRMSPHSVVVVVLPLEPVMARVCPRRKRDANSTSPSTVCPKARTWRISGVSSGTPGLSTRKSCRRKVNRPWPPASTAMPSSSSIGISFSRASALRTSDTVTCAPRRRRNSAAARPDRPRPTTSTRLPFSSIIPRRRTS